MCADSSKLLLNLVMEKGSPARRVMWKSFVKMRHVVPKLDKILKQVQELGLNPFDTVKLGQSLSKIPNHLKVLQQKHKETLRIQTEMLRVNTIQIKEKVKTFQLVDRYAELTIISTVRDRTLVEHELLARGRDHEEWREKHLWRELEKIQTDQLFQSNFSQKKFTSGRTVAVSGVPGIGKTTMLQKIVYDWATGKIYQHFQFIFYFKFRDLNTINCSINLKNLILEQYPYFENVLGNLWKNPENLLFIFDSLDEFRERIDFSDNLRPQSVCTDPEYWCEVSDIVYSLIQHKLLPGCSVLVTTRPTDLVLLEKAEISMWAEILGFADDDRKEYFNKFFEDQTVAAAIYNHLKENEILYTMSYNPSYCWILCLSLGPFLAQCDRKEQKVPKTMTQLYSYYIYNILKHHCREIENPRDVLLKLGEMAFKGISEKKIIFRNGELIQYDLQPSQFLSGFLMELLERDDSVQSVIYTFPHLTIQEFVAALAQFLTPDPTGIQKLLSIAYSKTTCRVIDWVKEMAEGQVRNTRSNSGKRDFLNTLQYLFESQNKALVWTTVRSMETLIFSRLQLTPVDCFVLSHVIGLCETIKLLDLENCYVQHEGLQQLASVLYKCREVRLRNNDLGNPAVKLLSEALRSSDCQIEKLQLNDNDLTASCAQDLASALSTNQSLISLNLGENKLGDFGVKQLFGVLRNVNCKLQELVLHDNHLSHSCIEELTSALITNQSLTVLNLGNNKLGDTGVKLLSVALNKPTCKILELGLWGASLSDSCTKDLACALSTNQTLTTLKLGTNLFTDQSVPAISHLILNCRSLERIELWENQFTLTGKRQLESMRESRRKLKRVVSMWNELPEEIVDTDATTMFQRHLGRYMNRTGLEGYRPGTGRLN
ncbi:NACHT, LRR and PYD domains-containing protein 3-like [Hemiscyllium ocellatum]|uniref:NACHT, LRR and PYD domains-containing protein 3-like n=1 Tax=Hemiscyllium ocellatum TaxID=170820 RepID=UPI00296675FC|nr:NACHT, LRR and PYD domains-containing protein 3-like [Hemiscyllium ocellatum]